MSFIKNILIKRYCPNCTLVKLSDEAITELNTECKNLKKENQRLSLLNKIQKFNLMPQNITYIEKIENSFFLITVDNEFDLHGLISNINFCGYTLEPFTEYPKCVMRLDTHIIYDNKLKCVKGIKIIDIIGESNKGYGSKLMTEFFRYTKPLNAKYITGELSPVDEFDLNNKALRNHFYKKFGFKITKTNIYKELNA